MIAITLDEDGIVFVRQLHQVRHDMDKLRIEERTLEDRLLTILRGNNARTGVGPGVAVERYVADGEERVTVELTGSGSSGAPDRRGSSRR